MLFLALQAVNVSSIILAAQVCKAIYLDWDWINDSLHFLFIYFKKDI
jgi:hypothetical protein